MRRSNLIEDLMVHPVFSVDQILHHLDPEVFKCTDKINEHLKEMESWGIWQKMSVRAAPVEPVTSWKTKRESAYMIDVLAEDYMKHHKTPLSTPYLIGALMTYPDEVKRSLEESFSIEVVEAANGCLVRTKLSSVPRQLCIRRSKEGSLVVPFSEYVQARKMRADGRIGDKGVTFLVYEENE